MSVFRAYCHQRLVVILQSALRLRAFVIQNVASCSDAERSTNMAKRTGVPAILAVAKELCRLLAKYSGVIVALYPNNAELAAALAAANTACAALAVQLEGVREFGD